MLDDGIIPETSRGRPAKQGTLTLSSDMPAAFFGDQLKSRWHRVRAPSRSPIVHIPYRQNVPLITIVGCPATSINGCLFAECAPHIPPGHSIHTIKKHPQLALQLSNSSLSCHSPWHSSCASTATPHRNPRAPKSQTPASRILPSRRQLPSQRRKAHLDPQEALLERCQRQRIRQGPRSLPRRPRRQNRSKRIPRPPPRKAGPRHSHRPRMGPALLRPTSTKKRLRPPDIRRITSHGHRPRRRRRRLLHP